MLTDVQLQYNVLLELLRYSKVGASTEFARNLWRSQVLTPPTRSSASVQDVPLQASAYALWQADCTPAVHSFGWQACLRLLLSPRPLGRRRDNSQTAVGGGAFAPPGLCGPRQHGQLAHRFEAVDRADAVPVPAGCGGAPLQQGAPAIAAVDMWRPKTLDARVLLSDQACCCISCGVHYVPCLFCLDAVSALCGAVPSLKQLAHCPRLTHASQNLENAEEDGRGAA